MSRVVTFGELMLRLSPPSQARFSQASHFEIVFGGAEANTAVMLAQLLAPVEFITRLPENDLADRALAELRGLGVEVGRVRRGGERMGIYFLEHGASQRAGKVIYDRAHSSLAEARREDFAWPELFLGADWFHVSGITPALSSEVAAIVGEACAVARGAGLTVSFDLNYRAKLWTCADAAATLAPLLKSVDLCVTSVDEARAVFGIDPGDCLKDREKETARQLAGRFGFHTVALTQRQASQAHETRWGAMLWRDGKAWFSPEHEIAIVDRVGAGDSFSGALIFALRRGDGPQKALDFAVAASCLKHTVAGDYNRVRLAEIEALEAGGGGGRVQR